MKKWWYLWLIPLLWAVCSLLSLQFPGDEYGLYALSSIVGGWLILLTKPHGHLSNPVFWLSITSAGIVVMAIAGFILSVLQTKLKLWMSVYIIASFLIFLNLFFSYPSIEEAISKNGSIFAYIFSSLNFGLYVSVLLSPVLQGIIKLFNSIMTRNRRRISGRQECPSPKAP